MTQHLHESSPSLAVMNGEQSHKAKKFHRAFTNNDLPLCALDVSSIYTSVSTKSGEDAHITCRMGDLGGPTLNQPRLGFSYKLSRLWDPGGVSSRPRAFATSRYPYTTHMNYDDGKTFI